MNFILLNVLNSNLPIWQCWDTTNNLEPLSATITPDKMGILVVQARSGGTTAGIFMIYSKYLGYVSPSIHTIARSNTAYTDKEMFTVTATNDYVFTITPNSSVQGLRGWFIVK